MIFPSLFEGFGLPILEAYASGVPVACSTGSAIAEVAAGYATLFDPKDSLSVARGITKALDKGKESTSPALQYAQGFTWDRTAQQTKAIYEAL